MTKKVEEKAPENVAQKVEEKAPENVAQKASTDSYIMKVTLLSWGKNGKNKFYAKKKPLINAKEMGEYAGTLDIWLKNGWIEKGSYKK